MKTSFVMGAAFLVAGDGAANAGVSDYTFADADGLPYCDGLQLSLDSGVAVGVHTNGAQCAEGDYAGGLQVRVSGSKGKRWMGTTTDVNNLPGVVETYVLDFSNMTWQVYDQDTANDLEFQLANEGVLLDGTPPARVGKSRVSGHKHKS